jgi:DNA-directed RNA polymerase subunit alpha
VRQVSYKVENTRVGQELDYDKLTLTVETDGTVTPEDAVAYAARILQDQLQLFVHFDEGIRSRSSGDDRHGRAARGKRRQPAQPLPAQEGRRARAVGAQRQLPQERQHHLHRRPGPEDRGRDAAHAELRPQELNEIKEVLSSMGLRLGMDIPGWPPENIEEMAKKLEQELLG